MRRSPYLLTHVALVVASVTLAGAPPAGAEPEMTAARKAGRGLAGLTTFPLELPGNVVQEGRTNGYLAGATVGLAMGIGKMVARPLVGVYELLTAPFPIPQGFEPVLSPEFPWRYFSSEPGRVYGFTPTYLDEEKQAIEQIPGAVVVRRRGALALQFPADLLFESGSATLRPAARSRLQQLATVLRDHPDTLVEVLGHTDAVGTADVNLSISDARSDAVRSYLVGQGVNGARISATGYGATAPVATNETPAGRQANRRVEIQIRKSGVAAYR
ncbi:MAG: exosortase system-associated protein, TIGR04073 family [Myxococcota bacterium]|nr:exosortase system-associated protein, TIGR04073 family [Myxococcota bacterium]